MKVVYSKYTQIKQKTHRHNKSLDQLTNNIHICIPCADTSFTKTDFYKLIISLNIGYINSINIRYNSIKNFNRVVIYFKLWYNNDKANKLKELLVSGKGFNLVYDFPHYWKCVLYKFDTSYNKIHNSTELLTFKQYKDDSSIDTSHNTELLSIDSIISIDSDSDGNIRLYET